MRRLLLSLILAAFAGCAYQTSCLKCGAKITTGSTSNADIRCDSCDSNFLRVECPKCGRGFIVDGIGRFQCGCNEAVQVYRCAHCDRILTYSCGRPPDRCAGCGKELPRDELADLVARWKSRDAALVTEADKISLDDVKVLLLQHAGELDKGQTDLAIRGLKKLFYRVVSLGTKIPKDLATVPVGTSYLTCSGYSVLGKREEALDWLQISVALGLITLGTTSKEMIASPNLDPIRNEPRFKTIVEAWNAKPPSGKGYLGLTIQDLPPEECTRLMVPVGEAVVAAEILEGSPAEKCGLRVGDVIVRIQHEGGERWDGKRDGYLAWIQSKPPGTKIVITLLRDEKTVKIEAVLAPLQE